ncbi:hypothetical protein ASG87_00900 [Frateuria sp. Soil773]|uniref:TfoX/Sxy family protein n=1 Tax=Frateuria sp. Soil773 TaxID=1736407 RepID=UPI0006F433F4|nr:TfoX/Sxy family protein [Frateuria sp. Soil773]KRE92503.1 hypothetical protein ASG87_00900 [Frateuria sp. Soil773]
MNGFVDHLRDLFGLLGPIRARSMFGGHGLYHDGRMIALAMGEGVYLKTDEETRPAFAAAGCRPFEYAGKALSYWSVPAAAMDDPQAMLPWARLAHAAALRKARTPRRRPRGDRPPGRR